MRIVPPLGAFKARQNGTLSNLFLVEVVLHGKGLEVDDL